MCERQGVCEAEIATVKGAVNKIFTDTLQITMYIYVI